MSGWDAGTYEKVASPQEAWAREIIDRSGFAPGERVLDAGCGGGRVTSLLLEQGVDVVAVDADAAMVAKARETLPSSVPVLHQDLLGLELDAPVDAAFSCAVFHWITDPGGLRPPTAARWRSRRTPQVDAREHAVCSAEPRRASRFVQVRARHRSGAATMTSAIPCYPGGRPAPWAGLRGAEPHTSD